MEVGSNYGKFGLHELRNLPDFEGKLSNRVYQPLLNLSFGKLSFFAYFHLLNSDRHAHALRRERKKI